MTAGYRDPAPPGRERLLLPDASLLSATWEGFDESRAEGAVRAVRALRRWVSAAAAASPSGEDGPPSGVVLSGPVGVGKTHLLCAAARDLSARLPGGLPTTGYRVLVVGERQLHQYVRACWSRGEGLPDRLRRAMAGANRSWLFYDDLGCAAEDERFAREVSDVLTMRHASPFAPLTVMTTNAALPALEEAFGARLASRLREKLLAYPLEGDDQRSPRRAS